jgi:hypothetical protein
MHFFYFIDTCYLGSNDSTKFLEYTVVFGSFSKGHSNTGSRMLWHQPELIPPSLCSQKQNLYVNSLLQKP